MALTTPLRFPLFRVLALLLLLIAQPTIAATAPHNADDPYLLILYDQPRSVGTIPTQRVAALWLAAFAAAYPPPFRVVVAGFDEVVHGQMSASLTHPDDLAAIQRQITELSSQGKVTDLEALLSYLNESPLPQEALAVVVISDGKPEIWDRALGYISQRVVADARYDKLHQQRLKLKKAGLDRFKLYDQLGAAYQQHNLQLILPHLAPIRSTFGRRLVVIDTLGQLPHLPKWSKQMGAIYLHLLNNGTDLTRQLQPTIDRLLPSITVKSAPKLPPPTPVAAPTPPPPPATTLAIPLPAPPPPADLNPPTRIAIPLPPPPAPPTLVAEPIASAPANPDKKGDLLKFIVALLVITALLLARIYLKIRAGRRQKLLEDEATRTARALIQHDRARAMAETETRHQTVFTENRRFFTHERRSSLRFPLQPGVLKVVWFDDEGREQQGDVVDISMNSIQFLCAESVPKTIDHIIAPALEFALPIVQATLQQRDSNCVIAQLHEFGNGLDGRMQWLDLIPRLHYQEP